MMHIRVQDQTLFVESLHFTARLEGGLLVSLVDRENKPAVIWAFRDAVVSYAGAVCDLESGARIQVDRRLPVRAGHVYRFDGSSGHIAPLRLTQRRRRRSA